MGGKGAKGKGKGKRDGADQKGNNNKGKGKNGEKGAKGAKGGKKGGKGQGKGNGKKGKGKGNPVAEFNNQQRAQRFGPYEARAIANLEWRVNRQEEMMGNMVNPFTLVIIAPAVEYHRWNLQALRNEHWRECQRGVIKLLRDLLDTHSHNTTHISDTAWEKGTCQVKIDRLVAAANAIVAEEDVTVAWVKIDRTSVYVRFQQNPRGRRLTDLVLLENAVKYYNNSLKLRLLSYPGTTFAKYVELKENPARNQQDAAESGADVPGGANDSGQGGAGVNANGEGAAVEEGAGDAEYDFADFGAEDNSDGVQIRE
jgi:hypothetical protein